MFLGFLVILFVLYGNDLIVWWAMPAWGAIYIAMIMLAAYKLRWNFFLYSYHKGGNEKEIALTFDDGPDPATNDILDILKKHKVPAAFFCIGKKIEQYPDILKRVYTEGHIVGNHSYTHSVRFDWKTTKQVHKELIKTNNLIKDITGWEPLLFRPPFGVTNPNIAGALDRTNLKSIGWSIRSYDTMIKSGKTLKKRLLRKIDTGDIIILHDTKDVTKEILSDFIVTAQDMGYKFVRVDRMLSLEAYK